MGRSATRVRLSAAFAVTLVGACTAGGNAAGGYGPFTPPSGTPSQFRNVQTVKTLGVGGGRLTARLANSVRLTVKVPAHTFSKPVQIAIAAPTLKQLTAVLHTLGVKHYAAATGFGIFFADGNGEPVKGRFSKAVTLTVDGKVVGIKGEKSLKVASPTKSSPAGGKTKKGDVTLSTRTSSDLLFANPAR
ncbi:MAG TPA: hypothetical protein VH063_04285 [Gaiellaceae bacterium]|nr:hypothetical protein [Gaiellaceae bacterium]